MNVSKTKRADGFRDFALVTLAVFLGGCTVGPNYHRPVASVPAAYPQTLTIATNQLSPDLAQWWRVFDDPQLD